VLQVTADKSDAAAPRAAGPGQPCAVIIASLIRVRVTPLGVEDTARIDMERLQIAE
jgi:hypothetical protein